MAIQAIMAAGALGAGIYGARKARKSGISAEQEASSADAEQRRLLEEAFNKGEGQQQEAAKAFARRLSNAELMKKSELARRNIVGTPLAQSELGGLERSGIQSSDRLASEFAEQSAMRERQKNLGLADIARSAGARRAGSIAAGGDRAAGAAGALSGLFAQGATGGFDGIGDIFKKRSTSPNITGNMRAGYSFKPIGQKGLLRETAERKRVLADARRR